MGNRFFEYLRQKGITQKYVSEVSGVSESTVSRFCQGQAIATDKLVKILEPFKDLSLEWLFFEHGNMLRKTFVVSDSQDIVMDHAVVVKHSKGVSVNHQNDLDLIDLLHFKDELICEKDRMISEKDHIILSLLDAIPTAKLPSTKSASSSKSTK